MLIFLCVIKAFIKGVLIFFLEASKRNYLANTEIQESIGDELIGGFWSRSLSMWFNGTMLLGFRSIITVEDLDSLGTEFSSERLSNALYQNLRESISLQVLVTTCQTTAESSRSKEAIASQLAQILH